MHISLARRISLTIAISFFAGSSCNKIKPMREPVSASIPPGELRKAAPAPQAPVAPEPLTTQTPDVQAPKKVDGPQVSPDCDTSLKFKDDEPYFLSENKVFVTRILSPCLGADGKTGHKNNAGWMVMGFPCTGGEGRIDWKGTNYNKPKMVSFLLETSCPAGPLDHSKIQKEASEKLGVSKDSKLLALTPFVIQYWEIPESADADTSFAVDLRTNKGLDQVWTSFIKPKPLRIHLFGRENAWVPGNFMYAVEGDLVWASKNRFTFKVDQARHLTSTEISTIKSRCEALKPPRDCSRVFSP